MKKVLKFTLLTIGVLLTVLIIWGVIVTQKPKKELTAEQGALSYSKYFTMEMAKPNQSLIDAVNKGQMNPSDAISISQVNKLLEPGYQPTETGYCILPDASGYVSALTQMPGVTIEMINWWFTWHPQNPLRYKIWDPDDHFDIKISAQDRKRLTDKSIPLNERNWGCTHLVLEDIGVPRWMKVAQRIMGKNPYEIEIHFISPQEFGFDMTKFDPLKEAAICSTLGMCHYVRQTKNGVEVRTRFFLGYDMVEGKFVRNKSSIPVEILKNLNLHAIKEFAHLAKILPSIYKEEKDK